MPTGLTWDLKPDSTLNEFAWRCARQFGALVTMRDEPDNAPIPLKFEPGWYYTQSLKEAEERLRELEKMSVGQAAREAEKEYRMDQASAEEMLASAARQRAIYESMLEKVRAWQPPTPGHEGLKKLMVRELEESIDFDGSTKYAESLKAKPEKDGRMWLLDAVARARSAVESAKESVAGEAERAAERTAWVQALAKSVGDPPKVKRS